MKNTKNTRHVIELVLEYDGLGVIRVLFDMVIPLLSSQHLYIIVDVKVPGLHTLLQKHTGLQ